MVVLWRSEWWFYGGVSGGFMEEWVVVYGGGLSGGFMEELLVVLWRSEW